MKKSKLVGILNITPDSFSDGGKFNTGVFAAKQLEQIIGAGPDIIDIGAISTRPNACVPSSQEEIFRFKTVLPEITPILKQTNIKISIDSFHSETVAYLLDKINIDWINDQKSGADKKMISLAIENNLNYMIMHHLTIPADPKIFINQEEDVIEIVKNWLMEKAKILLEFGMKKNQIILDPGIGFGKTAEQSWKLIREAESFLNTGFQILYGHSRKSFLNTVTNKPFIDRDFETSVISSFLSSKGIDYLRVHDVELSKRAIKLKEYME
ncbi:MAG: dihydropteroate synthase [Pseudomonadota bacterium]